MLRSSVHPVRHALLLALGLTALACGPGKGTSDDDSDTATSDSAGTTAATSATPTTGATSGGIPAMCSDTLRDIDQLYTDPPVPSGFIVCGGALPHRGTAVTCEVPAAPTNCTDNTGGGSCTTNEDCTDMPHGSCRQDVIFGGLLLDGTCSCSYGCATDSDCADGQICRCAGEGLGLTAQCIAADCSVDADCGDQLCTGNIGTCSDSIYALHCTTPDDTCNSNGECNGSPCNWEDFEKPAHWACENVDCGRPYLIDAVAVLAPAVARDDWHEPLVPALPAARERLAAAWTELARSEHASIASFAAFTLQLLAIGAPPELLRSAHQALADELEHARLGFGLASAYAGHPVGPGPMPIAATPPCDLASVLIAVIREACVCETLSALEAREAAAHATDPVVARVWSRIAADELRHSELGWRTAQWIVRAAPELRPLAHATFTAAIAEATRGAQRDAHAPADLELRRHGLVDPSLRAAIRRRGLAELINPCANTLCAAA
jgi:hypothetical protein